ncbi:hypothetical protein [Mesorhizobium sp. M0571]|uniref:hypothetical protein n=1 Tax=Mesorhizobium sp. M0571 TaxID=2956960 RepID=UPI0033358D73
MRQLTAVVCSFVALLQGSETALAQDVPVPAPNIWLVYGVIGAVFLFALMGFGYVRRAVSESTFSLGEALSEEDSLSVMEKDAMGNKIPKVGSDGKPLMATVLVGSTSRVIALSGSIMILLLFTGAGVFVLYYFALGLGVPKEAMSR